MEFCGPSRSCRPRCRSSICCFRDHVTNGIVRGRNLNPKEYPMKRLLLSGSLLWITLLWASPALSFCGFYVARGDAKLFNHASKVVMVRDGDRTVLTMSNDYSGEPDEFAIVVPVPTLLEKGQIHVGDRAVLDHLDAYSAPRLVEYFDPDPCRQFAMEEGLRKMAAPQASGMMDRAASERARSLGVTIEARYTVGEYDILILSAKQSGGLGTWLTENGYTVPRGARRVLASYMRQGMKFFVAKVNLNEQRRLGFSYLRPLQMAYESPKFMLPLRLGMVNADGPQELFVYAITKNGRVETTNYRTVRLPEGMDIPEYVKDDFPRFYRALFTRQVENENREAVLLEYAWNMSWCDPCAADPLTAEELRGLGVFWLGNPGAQGQGFVPGGPQNTFITRLHVRYDAAHFPEDLVFQETADQSNFQARYVLRHPWTGGETCEAAEQYRRDLARRQEQEVRTLATLTGWPIAEIRAKAPPAGAEWPAAKTWWRQ